MVPPHQLSTFSEGVKEASLHYYSVEFTLSRGLGFGGLGFRHGSNIPMSFNGLY